MGLDYIHMEEQKQEVLEENNVMIEYNPL